MISWIMGERRKLFSFTFWCISMIGVAVWNGIIQCVNMLNMADEIVEKMNLLLEYYKYHNEIPRLFMVKLSEEMSKYTK